MKKWLYMVFLIAVSYTSGAQSTDTILVTGSEYIPVKGRGETPLGLEGEWKLSKGLKARPTNLQEKFNAKKMAPGTEISRDSVTTSRTVNGVTHTTTDVEIRQVKAQSNSDYTPPQGKSAHKPSKPTISFFGLNESVSGFTGCNKFSGRYSVKGKKISFKNVAASTQMACLGQYDEKEFLSKLRKVNSFKNSDGQLRLMSGEEVLLVFSRK